MGEFHAMEILKTACDILQLRPNSMKRSVKCNTVRTSFSGLAWWFPGSFKNSMMFPLSIHGATMEYSLSFIITPIRGNMFG